MCNSTWCSTSDPSPIFSIKESTFAEAINSTHNGFTNALYEVNPLVTLPYRLHYTDDRLQDARWLIESSEIPSRTPLIQVIVQYLETSGHVRDDLSMFIAQVGGTIDFVLFITDWTIQDLTRIAQQIQMPEDPSVAGSTLSTPNDFIPYNHARILFNYATAVILPDFVLRSYQAFYRSFPKASADTAIRSVVSTFVMYIDEISPRIIVLTSQADELLANIKRLQTDLDNIHSVLVHDTRSLSASRAVIEDQRYFWTKFWAMVVGGADDMGAIERQVNTLSRIDQVVTEGVKSLARVLWTLKGVNADLEMLKEKTRRYKHLHRLAKGYEMLIVCNIQTIELSAEKLRLVQED